MKHEVRVISLESGSVPAQSVEDACATADDLMIIGERRVRVMVDGEVVYRPSSDDNWVTSGDYE